MWLELIEAREKFNVLEIEEKKKTNWRDATEKTIETSEREVGES